MVVRQTPLVSHYVRSRELLGVSSIAGTETVREPSRLLLRTSQYEIPDVHNTCIIRAGDGP